MDCFIMLAAWIGFFAILASLWREPVMPMPPRPELEAAVESLSWPRSDAMVILSGWDELGIVERPARAHPGHARDLIDSMRGALVSIVTGSLVLVMIAAAS